jgi:hypothetical protein
MLDEAVQHLKARTTLEKIYFVLFDNKALLAFQDEMRRMYERGDLGGGTQNGGHTRAS